MTDLLDPIDEATFEALVGEGKKFKDPDALAKGKLEADHHIANLEKELSDMRAELQGRLSMEELLDKVQTRTSNDEVTPPNPLNVRTDEQEDGLVSRDLAKEVRALVEAERKKERREANVSSAKAELKKRFGADYNSKLQNIADSLEVSVNMLSDMAATSPAGFIKLIDSVAKPDKDISIPNTQIDTNRDRKEFTSKNAAYYKELRRSDPKTYWSKHNQVEMNREAVRQGSAFYE